MKQHFFAPLVRAISALCLCTIIGGLVPPAPLNAQPQGSADISRAPTAQTLPHLYPSAPQAASEASGAYALYLPLVAQEHAPVTFVLQPGNAHALTAWGGTVLADFSARAVQTPTRVSLQSLDRPLLAAGAFAVGGPAFRLSAQRVADGSAIDQFPPAVQLRPATATAPATAIVTPSVTLTLRYSDADVWGLDLRTLALYARETNADAWQRLPTTVDPARKVLITTIDHLGQFVPLAALAADAPPADRKRLVLDPDDNVGHAYWDGVGTVRELPYNYRLAQGVQQKLTDEKCAVEVLITRDASRDYVPLGDRVGSAITFGADMYTTLAFNALNGSPWGFVGDGGIRGWARYNHPDDDALVNEFFTRVQGLERPHTRGVQHPYPDSYYAPIDTLPASTTYAHIETLFLDHNYDWPVINTGFSAIVDAAYAAVSQRLGAAGMLCGNQPPRLPAPPSAEQLKRWRDLGNQNYQRYGADPVSFSTGNHVLLVSLARVPGRGGLDINLTLTYNAQDGRDDLFGFSWSFPYSARALHYSDDSVSVVLHDGRTYHYQWDGSRYVAPEGVYDRLEKTSDGWRWITPGETVLTFQETLGGFGILTHWQERRGNAFQFSYDLSGQDAWRDGNPVPRPPLTELRDAAGRVVRFQHDRDGHISTMVVPDGRQFTFGYSNGDLTTITDARGGTRRYAYDARHRITHEWDAEDIHFLENRYDDRDRVVGQTDADGTQNTLSYDPIGHVTTFTDNGGQVTRYVYDAQNRVIAVQDALGATGTTTYDAQYNIIAQRDARGFETRFSYDARGNLVSRSDPIDGYSSAFYGSDTTLWTYDEHNQPTSMTNALGATWHYAYDAQGNLVQAVAPDGSQSQATYDAHGQVLQYTDANGHATSFSYDAYGNRVLTTDALGNRAQSSYDAAGRETRFVDTNGHGVDFTYDANGNVTQLVDPNGRASNFIYDRNDLLVRATDRRGGERQYEYDANLKLLAERDPLGGWTRYTYDALYRRVSMTDPLGRQSRYTYDAVGRLVTSTDARGATVRYGYDAAGNVVMVVDPLGHRTSMVYDAVGRLKFATDASGARTEYCYDAEDRLIRSIGPRGEVTDYAYDALSRLVSVKDALGNVSRYSYDAAGNRTEVVDALGNRIETRYDALDRPVAIVQAALADGTRPTTQLAYDAVGNALTMTNPRGFVTSFSYDATDKLTQTRDPLGGTTRSTYDAEGALVAVSDPLGHTSTTTYDLNGRPTQVTDARGQTTTLTYDAVGQLTAMRNALDHTTTYVYDAVGQLAEVIDPLGNRTQYTRDAAGHLVARTDANGHTTRYAYDAMGRLLGVTDALTGTTSYEYDRAGNLTTISDANGQTTRFAFNFLNQMVQETNPLSGTWRYAYDGAGRMIRRVDALWRATLYAYDSAGRLTDVTYDGAPTQHPITYTYDLNGNQTGMCDALGCTSQRYDARDRLIGVTDWSGRTITHTYDLAGNMTALRYPNGDVVGYAYDATNQLTRMIDPHDQTIAYGRNVLGQVTQVARPNGTLSTFRYDATNRLIGIDNRRDGEAQPHSAYAYALDRVGNRVQVSETRAAFDNSPLVVTLTHQYDYDALDRLVRATTTATPARATGYDFDAVGNRLSMSGTAYVPDAGTPALPVAARPAAATSRYNAANQLMEVSDSDGVTTFAYNTNGDRVRETTTVSGSALLLTDYAYDREDRLIGVTKAVSDTSGLTVTLQAQYAYDGYGRRATKTVTYPNAITLTQVLSYTYDGLDLIGARLLVGGVISETHYYLAPSPVTGLRRPAEVERLANPATGFAGDRYWYEGDGLDSVAGLTDASGALVSPQMYDDYGRPLVGASDLQIFGYTAQDYDVETGLLHFYARYYDAARGVWLTQDAYRGEIGQTRGLNGYSYVQSSPITFLDILGFLGVVVYDPNKWTDYKSTSGRDYHYGKHVLGFFGGNADMRDYQKKGIDIYAQDAANLLNVPIEHNYIVVTDCKGHYGKINCARSSDWEVVDANKGTLAVGEERTSKIRTFYKPNRPEKIAELMSWDYAGANIRAKCNKPPIKPNFNYSLKPDYKTAPKDKEEDKKSNFNPYFNPFPSLNLNSKNLQILVGGALVLAAGVAILVTVADDITGIGVLDDSLLLAEGSAVLGGLQFMGL